MKFLILLGMIICAFSSAKILYATDTNTGQSASVDVGIDIDNQLYSGAGGSNQITSRGTVNTHLNPGIIPFTERTGYIGQLFPGHQVQGDILKFVLSQPGELWYTIKHSHDSLMSMFVNAESESRRIIENLPEQRRVRVIQDISELGNKSWFIAGIIDTYSNDQDETEWDCFMTAIQDTGNFGGNYLLLLKRSFSAGEEGSGFTIGLNATGGILDGAKKAGSGTTGFGYTRGQSQSITYPYIHGVALLVK